MVWAATGVAAVGGAFGIAGGLSAKKHAKAAAKAQAKMTYAQRQQEIKQQKQVNRYQTSLGKASSYASNLQMSGTNQSYIKAMDYENMRGIAKQERAAVLERKAIRKGASGAGDAAIYGGVSQILGAVAGAAISNMDFGGTIGVGGQAGVGGTSGTANAPLNLGSSS
jgi:hypothetical protein